VVMECPELARHFIDAAAQDFKKYRSFDRFFSPQGTDAIGTRGRAGVGRFRIGRCQYVSTSHSCGAHPSALSVDQH
jgi:hypothetical protein